MTQFGKNVLASVVAAALVANVAILFQFGERLSRIEVQLEAIKHNQHMAIK
jgi:hypothetical protein